ncbi:MAG: WD40 repeat domain-containing serine/threonine-protein kinase [Kofleriaceae bacterium]
MSEREDFASQETVAAKANPKPRVEGREYDALTEVDPEHYNVFGELARGGMGRIVRAFDRRLGRGVAIKELLAGNDTTRFEREARITARLVHPSIVGVYEAGVWPSGEPFFAMELVAGESLDKRIAKCGTLAERLALVPAVAAVIDALAYAHSEKVIHRDLKPSNVLVGKYGETVVIDWGLAKDLTKPDEPSIPPERIVRDDGATVAGSVMGTPAYMPPEQADGSPVDERADVYALGALLYHVIAGRPPYLGTSSTQVLARVLTDKPKSLAEVEPDAPVELVAIVEKAMARGRQYRFQNAVEMADELRRFQTGQLVSSHRYTFGELVRRWMRRYRAPIAVGVIGLVALGIFGIVSISKILTETHRADLEAADARARADRGTLEHARSLLATDPTAAVAAVQELSPNAREWADARTVIADAQQRGIAQIFHADIGADVTDADLSPDGSMLVGIEASILFAWDVETHVVARRLPTRGGIMRARWSGNGVVFVEEDGSIWRWQPFRDGGVELIGSVENVQRIDLSPDGRYVFAASDGGYDLIDLATKQRWALGSAYVHSWDGRAFVWLGNSERFSRLDLATGTITPLYTASDLAQNIWVASHDGMLYAPEPTTRSNHIAIMTSDGRTLATGHRELVAHTAFLPDGRLVTATQHRAIAGSRDLGDNDITIIDGTAIARLVGHKAPITSLRTHGDAIVSADARGEVRIWRRTPIAVEPQEFDVALAFLMPDRMTLVEHEGRSAMAVHDLVGGATRTMIWEGGEDHLRSDNARAKFYERAIGVRRAANRWVTQDMSGGLVVWDRNGGRPFCGIECRQKEQPYAISGDGNVVALVKDGAGWLYDARTKVVKPIAFEDEPTMVALDETGDVLAFISTNGILYDIRFGAAEQASLRFRQATELAFSKDNKRLAVVDGQYVRIIDSSNWKPIRTLAGHSAGIYDLQVDELGRYVTLSADRTARIWDTQPIVLDAGTATFSSIDIHDGKAVTVDDEHQVKLWDLATLANRVLPARAAIYAGIMANGEIVVVEADGRLSRFRDTTPYGEAALRVWSAAILLAHHSGSSVISQ